MTDAAELEAGLEQLRLPLTDAQQAQLLAFAVLLLKWNRKINLISRGDVARIISRHLLDSLTPLPWLIGMTVADLGSGAGLPGVPLAIACPDREFTLIDRSERRTRFIRQAVIDLALDNVNVVTADLDSYRPEHGFDTVVSRAVDEPAQLWQRARALLADAQGRAVLQCGRDTAETGFSGVASSRFINAPVPGLADNHYLWVLEPG